MPLQLWKRNIAIYKKRITPQVEVNYLNEVLTRCGKGDINIPHINYLDRTEDGEEYSVMCSDEQERILLQHICSNGITWMWKDDYEEFMENLRWL